MMIKKIIFTSILDAYYNKSCIHTLWRSQHKWWWYFSKLLRLNYCKLSLCTTSSNTARCKVVQLIKIYVKIKKFINIFEWKWLKNLDFQNDLHIKADIDSKTQHRMNIFNFIPIAIPEFSSQTTAVSHSF